jgi:epsilon-lactone hydrolase
MTFFPLCFHLLNHFQCGNGSFIERRRPLPVCSCLQHLTVEHPHMPSLLATLINKFVLPLQGTKAQMSDTEDFIEVFNAMPRVAPEPRRRIIKNIHIERQIVGGCRVITAKLRGKASAHHILYLHGPFYVTRLLKSHWNIVYGLMERTGATVTIPHYPLGPRLHWRENYAAIEPLYEELRRKTPQGMLAIAGESAGGGLALSLAQMLRNSSKQLPDKILLFSPWLDFSLTDPGLQSFAEKDQMLGIPGLRWIGRCWAGDLSTTDPRISPIYGSVAGLPRLAIFTGTADLLHVDACRLKRLAERDKASLEYYEYSDLFHVWMAAPILEAETALNQAATFLNSSLSMCSRPI